MLDIRGLNVLYLRYDKPKNQEDMLEKMKEIWRRWFGGKPVEMVVNESMDALEKVEAKPARENA